MPENHNIEKAVKFLAQDNFEVEDGLERIVWLRHAAGDRIRLIEVTRNGLPAGRIEVFFLRLLQKYPLTPALLMLRLKSRKRKNSMA